MLYPLATHELVALINARNLGSPLRDGDVSFTLLKTDEDGTCRVEVTPAEGVIYYGEQEITYRRRALDNAILGVPVKVSVQNSVTYRKVLELFVAKYGFTFNEVVDFVQAELDKEVSFAQSGLTVVELPAAAESLVWIGKLSIVVANDALDLENILVNTTLTNLVYLHNNGAATSSLELATMNGDFTPIAPQIEAINVGQAIPRNLGTQIRDIMVAQNLIPENQYTTDGWLGFALSGCKLQEKKLIGEDKYAFFKQSFSGGWDGTAILRYGQADPLVATTSTGNELPLSGEAVAPAARFTLNRADETLDLNVRLGPGTPSYVTLASNKLTYLSKTETTSIYTATFNVPANAVAEDVTTLIVSDSKGRDIGSFSVKFISTKYDGTNWVLTASTGWVYFDFGTATGQIDWGDGTVSSTGITGVQRHEYTGAGTYTCNVTVQDNSKLDSSTQFFRVFGTGLRSVVQWASKKVKRIQFTSVDQAFTVPNWLPESVTTMDNMFYQCINFNDPNVSKWDTTNVISMQNTFQEARTFNQQLNNWNVSNVTNMTSMFAGNNLGMAFNQPLDKWNLRVCRKFSNMFWYCTQFNQDLSMWAVGATTAANHSGFNTNANAAWVADAAKQPKWVA